MDEMVVSVLRLSQEWLQRGPNHVLALRSTFNLGLDVWGATDNGIPGDPMPSSSPGWARLSTSSGCSTPRTS